MSFKSLTDCFVLPNGVKIPCIGFGTWQNDDGTVARNAVKAALDAGYRHIDGAIIYGNEKSTGAVLKDCGIPRDELFITSKLFNDMREYKNVKISFETSLKDLGLDYLDLYLIHWPNPVALRDRWEDMNAESWRAMEELYDEGKIRAIGISNFHAHHIDALLKTARIKPMVNQIRLCPSDTQDAVVKASRERGLLIEAYSPFGGSDEEANILKDPVISEIADKYGKNTAHVCVRWCLQHDYLPLPKSTTASHIQDNAKVFDFELSDQDMARLDNLTGYDSPFPHPDKTTW